MLERELLQRLLQAKPPQLPTSVGNSGSVKFKPIPQATVLELISSTIVDKKAQRDTNIMFYNIVGGIVLLVLLLVVFIIVITVFFPKRRSTNQDIEEFERRRVIRQDVQEIEMFSISSYSTPESHSLIEDADIV